MINRAKFGASTLGSFGGVKIDRIALYKLDLYLIEWNLCSYLRFAGCLCNELLPAFYTH